MKQNKPAEGIKKKSPAFPPINDDFETEKTDDVKIDQLN